MGPGAGGGVVVAGLVVDESVGGAVAAVVAVGVGGADAGGGVGGCPVGRSSS